MGNPTWREVLPEVVWMASVWPEDEPDDIDDMLYPAHSEEEAIGWVMSIVSDWNPRYYGDFEYILEAYRRDDDADAPPIKTVTGVVRRNPDGSVSLVRGDSG